MYGVIDIAEAGVGSLAVSLGNRCFIPTLGYTAWNSSVRSEWSCRTKISKGENSLHVVNPTSMSLALGKSWLKPPVFISL